MSSCATAPSTTSMKSGSTESLSSSAPSGAPPRRPSRCTAPRPARAMKLLGRLSRLHLKKAPWPQGARPLGGTRSVRCLRGKSRAVKKSLARKKLPGRSLLRHAATLLRLRHAKTPRCSLLQRVGTLKIELSTSRSLPWPPQAAVALKEGARTWLQARSLPRTRCAPASSPTSKVLATGHLP